MFDRRRGAEEVNYLFLCFCALASSRSATGTGFICVRKQDFVPVGEQVHSPHFVVRQPIEDALQVISVAVTVVDRGLVANFDELCISRMQPNSLGIVSQGQEKKLNGRTGTHKARRIRYHSRRRVNDLVHLLNSLCCRPLGLATEETDGTVGPANDRGVNLLKFMRAEIGNGRRDTFRRMGFRKRPLTSFSPCHPS